MFSSNILSKAILNTTIHQRKSKFLRYGWQTGVNKWDDLPIDVISDLVGKNYFFVPTELDRAIFIMELIDRRMELRDSKEGIAQLKRVLNEDLIYCHIPSNQLQKLSEFKDSNGDAYIELSVVENAIKMSFELAEVILSSTTENTEFEKSKSEFFKENNNSYYNEKNGKTIPYKYASLTDDDTKVMNKLIEDKKAYQIPPLRLSFELNNVDITSCRYTMSKYFFYAGSYWSIGIRQNKVGLISDMYIAIQRKSSALGKERGSGGDGLQVNSENEDLFNSLEEPKRETRKLTTNEKFIDLKIDQNCSTPNVSFIDKRSQVDTFLSIYFANSYDEESCEYLVVRYFKQIGTWANPQTRYYKASVDGSGVVKPSKISMVLGLV